MVLFLFAIVNRIKTRNYSMASRTFGWIQNPGLFSNLKSTIQIFIPKSKNHDYLSSILKDYSIISDTLLADNLYEAINKDEICLTYSQLVGTGRSKRNTAPCDALVQASIPDQKRIKGYVDNWTADGFVRWAECLGFINFNNERDTFTLTKLGYGFGCTSDDLEDKDNEFLLEGLLQYPPVHRVLSILNQEPTKAFSKFEIGAKLGFTGEAGFTSLPHDLIMDHLANESDFEEIKKIRSDREGSSDKYARMISGWLLKIGLVERVQTELENRNFDKRIKFGHNFKIKSKGIRALSKIEGKGKHRRVVKHVSWYMLATAAKNKAYLRTRRAKLLKLLKRKGNFSISEITTHMQSQGFEHAEEVFIKDLKGLNKCGITINEDSNQSYSLTSKICDFIIPTDQNAPEIQDKKLEQLKEQYLTLLPSLDPDYVELIEISRDRNQCLIFEAKVVEIFNKEYNLQSVHLGGASKPDGLSKFKDDSTDFGLIIDSKAYKDGYPLGASEKDKMVRYITENQDRDKAINSTQWWNYFPQDINNYHYLFVSSFFIRRFEEGLQQIGARTKITGGALNVEQLLLGAQMSKDGRLTTKDIPKHLNNSLVQFA